MPDVIDEVRTIDIEKCPHCGGSNLSECVEERERTVEDIPVCKARTTRYIIRRRYCKDCKRIVDNNTAVPALPKAHMGINTMLAVSYLRVGLRIPQDPVKNLMEKLFGLKISEGEIQQMQSQVGKAFTPISQEIVGNVRNAPARYMDDTVWRKNGENTYLWAFVTKNEALFEMADSRGHEVPEAVVGTKKIGVDVHDRWSAFKTLARLSKRPQQDCWAHLVQDSKELAQFYRDEGALIHRVMKRTYERACAFDHKGTEDDIQNLYREMMNDIDRPFESSHCRKFVESLKKEKENLFEFVKNPDVDGANNRAERALRHPVTARKISGGSRSDDGANLYAKLLSVYQTICLRGLDFLKHGATIILSPKPSLAAFSLACT
ncbi:MAG: IS66 family transposase [Candidatus Thermoplasmatota archaeon]